MPVVPVRIGLRRVVDDAHDAFHNVVYIGKVAQHVAIVEHLDGPVVQDGIRKEERRHVRPPPGAVDREEAQACRGDAVELAVGMGHQFVRLLRGRIEAHRMGNAALLRKGHVAVQPVDTAGAGVDQVLHPVVAAALQDVDEAVDVRLYVGIRIRDRVAHPGLRGQIAHPLEALVGKEHLHGLLVLQVHPHKTEVRELPAPDKLVPAHTLLPDAQLPQAAVLQRRVIILVDVVQPHDLVAPLQQPEHDKRPDEPRGTGH